MQIFFSYGHDKHSGVVKALKEEIESQSNGKITVWMDTYKITRDSHWRETITDGILNSESVIAFLSSHSAREESVCRDELSIALVSKHGMIRTVLLESLDSFTPPSRVSEYQWGDMSDYPEIEKQGEEAFKDYIKEEAQKIIKLVTSDDICKYNDEVKQLRRAFHFPEIEDWTKFDNLIEKELIGREWLFDRVEKWENDREGGNILMLYGKPGAGKSMFSAHLQMRDPSVAAAFPCDCRRSEYRKTDSIILNISYRLALRLPDYRRYVLEILSDSSFDLGSDQLFDRLILNPLSRCNIDGDRAVMVIVIDALDEMDNDELAKFISESADSLRKYVRFIITSRKIPAIAERFNRFVHIDLDDKEEESHTRTDLFEYFKSRIGPALMDYEGKAEFMERLIDNSNLVFTYAKCVCDNILEDIKNGDFQICDYSLPRGIEELFKQTLDRSFNSPNASYTMRDYESFWQIPLGMILASPEPLPVSTLRTLMQWRERDLKKFIEPLSTFVLCENECISFFHKSFGEWLNETKTKYVVSREDGISDLADACYDVYTEDPDSIDYYILLYTTQFFRASKKRGHRKQYEEIIMDESYTDKMFNRADELLNMEKVYRAMQFYSELVNIFDGVDFGVDEGKTACKQGVALNGIGTCYKAINKYEEALKCYFSYLEITKRLKEKYPDNSDYLFGYSTALGKVARTYEANNELKKAKEFCLEALEIDKQLKEKNPENSAYLSSYSALLNDVAGIYEKNKKFKKALEYYLEALEIGKQLKEKYSENSVYLSDYSALLNNVASIYIAQREYGKAKEYYIKELEICKNLKERYCENVYYLFCYFDSLEKIAGIYEVNRNYEKSMEYLLEGNEIVWQLKEKYPENPKYLSGYSLSLGHIAKIYKVQKEYKKALEYYLEALDIRKQLKEKYPENFDYLCGYSTALENIAGIYETNKKNKKAMELYFKALEVMKQLKEKSCEISDYMRGCSNLLEKIAGIYEADKKYEKALEYYNEALEIRKELKEKYRYYSDYLCDYYIELGNIAGVYEAIRNYEKALEYYLKALAIGKRLIENNIENTDYLLYYYHSLEEVARIYEVNKKYEKAMEYYLEAIEIKKLLK